LGRNRLIIAKALAYAIDSHRAVAISNGAVLIPTVQK